MSGGIEGRYDGEGSNVSGALSVAPGVDVPAQGTGDGFTATGQGRAAQIAVDRRSRIRVSDEGARSAAAISVGGGDQILTKYARGVLITTSGTIVGRLVEDTADQTFAGLVTGNVYALCFALIRQSGTTAAGLLLF
jgi:hypothetical protein